MIICLSLFMMGSLVAQEESKGQFTTKGEYDPAARKVLDQLKAKYDTFKALEVDVTLKIEIPESDVQIQKGKMVQTGDKYRIEMGDNIILSDGETVWTIMKDAEEVQITDAEPLEDEEESIMMSPKDLMGIYENGEYVYALTNEVRREGKLLQQIEFKPIDPDSEYFKIRINVDKKNQIIDSIKIFSKDGSRYTLTIDDFSPNKIYETKYFKFSDELCEGCSLEDLRF